MITISRQQIKACLEALPFELGSRFVIPPLQAALYLAPGRLKPRLLRWNKKRNKTREERTEAREILRAIRQKALKKVTVIYDNLSSPPTYGDYIFVVMLARYFIVQQIEVAFYIVDSEYRWEWGAMDEKTTKKLVIDQVEIANGLLVSSSVRIAVVTWKEIEPKIADFASEDQFIPFKNRIQARSAIYNSCFNLINHLISAADPELCERFLLSFEKIAPLADFCRASCPYIAWHCRYSKKWGHDRNVSSEEFVKIYATLRKFYPNYAIMVVSDLIGCEYFKDLSQRHGLPCLFSKDYSETFMGDGALVLGSDFYFQLRGGGMAVFPFFSDIPYEIISTVGNQDEWYKGRFSSWAHERQVFRNATSGLPSGVPV